MISTKHINVILRINNVYSCLIFTNNVIDIFSTYGAPWWLYIYVHLINNKCLIFVEINIYALFYFYIILAHAASIYTSAIKLYEAFPL